MPQFYGYAPAPGPDMVARLAQAGVWVDNQGTERAVTEMNADHLMNVLGYLVRHGRELWSYAHAGVALPSDAQVVDWLAASPLWKGIVAELRTRGALGSREDVFTTLRVRAATYRAVAVNAYSDDLDEQERLFLAR